MNRYIAVLSVFVFFFIIPRLWGNVLADFYLSLNSQGNIVASNQFILQKSNDHPQTYQPQSSFGRLLSTNTRNMDNPNTIGNSRQRLKDIIAKVNLDGRNTLQQFISENNIIPSPTDIPIPSQNVSAIMNMANPNPTIFSNLQNYPSAKPTAQTEKKSKKDYVIAVLGDSMIDTLGDFATLKSILASNFPGKTFTIYNYGFGSTDMESGLYRLTNETTYLGKKYPPLLSRNPDILVLESFAYNHWSASISDLDRQWLTIAKIIDASREALPDIEIILAATIAPDSRTFGDGILNWPENLKWDSTLIIKAYLQNIINFASSQRYPLADAYSPSLASNGQGKAIYINQTDHLHPSYEGGRLFSQKIADTMKKYEMVK
jgi:hypothetical protein